MFPLKKKIDGYKVESYSFSGWVSTKDFLAMYPTPESRQKEHLIVRYEPREETRVILSLIALLLTGVVAFGIFGGIVWELRLLGLF